MILIDKSNGYIKSRETRKKAINITRKSLTGGQHNYG
jgi:hypothetical protein